MTISPAERVERIRSLTYLLKVLRTRYVHALRGMHSAPTGEVFNESLRQAQDLATQIEKYRNELFDLSEAQP